MYHSALHLKNIFPGNDQEGRWHYTGFNSSGGFKPIRRTCYYIYKQRDHSNQTDYTGSWTMGGRSTAESGATLTFQGDICYLLIISIITVTIENKGFNIRRHTWISNCGSLDVILYVLFYQYFIRHFNLTSLDVRFWRHNSITTL